MNMSMILLEVLASVLGLGVLVAELFIQPSQRRTLGWLTAALVACVLVVSVGELAPADGDAFGGMFVVDSLSRFFKAFFLLGALVVILMTLEYSDRLPVGVSEFMALTLLAVTGMMFAASAGDLVMLFVSLELVTVTFYVLNSFQRHRQASLEAGIKYLILGALASGFLVFGIALIYGTSGTTLFREIAAKQAALAGQPLFLVGVGLVLAGLGFKVAAVPFQIWAPDVYEGSPVPATALLAAGSKGTGMVLMLRLLFTAIPGVAQSWQRWMLLAGMASILYGVLCAIPQRSLKRLMGYSSIANAGYLLLGVAVGSAAGSGAVLYYLGAYFFTTLGAFTALAIILNRTDSDEIASLAGMGRRSPLLAAVLALSMVSLAGIPPWAGFFGKFLIFRALAERGVSDPFFGCALAVAVIGAVISLYYYFGILRSMYWGAQPGDLSPIPTGLTAWIALAICAGGIAYLGCFPQGLMEQAAKAATVLHPAPPAGAAHAGAHH